MKSWTETDFALNIPDNETVYFKNIKLERLDGDDNCILFALGYLVPNSDDIPFSFSSRELVQIHPNNVSHSSRHMIILLRGDQIFLDSCIFQDASIKGTIYFKGSITVNGRIIHEETCLSVGDEIYLWLQGRKIFHCFIEKRSEGSVSCRPQQKFASKWEKCKTPGKLGQSAKRRVRDIVSTPISKGPTRAADLHPPTPFAINTPISKGSVRGSDLHPPTPFAINTPISKRPTRVADFHPPIPFAISTPISKGITRGSDLHPPASTTTPSSFQSTPHREALSVIHAPITPLRKKSSSPLEEKNEKKRYRTSPHPSAKKVAPGISNKKKAAIFAEEEPYCSEKVRHEGERLSAPSLHRNISRLSQTRPSRTEDEPSLFVPAFEEVPTKQKAVPSHTMKRNRSAPHGDSGR
ncbi:hypothetical protein PROFUN_13884 [Planoprotostelium fungivorum]|uniref:FHA domain-containing protein n=1 Tax=Planoprotostelium fungivorum TaxID=1890364 RepID=A0A2P6N2A3_9EUKA|nr:hypothetical protein PROFUN_13884 [Planoprotostelium fungivorum]